MQQEEAGNPMKVKKNHYSSLVKRINRSLVLLVMFSPFWLSEMFLCSIWALSFDFLDRFFGQSEVYFEIDSDSEDPHNQLPQNIVVLGDSLAAGVGTVEIFEDNLLEEETKDGPGPI
jgi:hypothetical protein